MSLNARQRFVLRMRMRYKFKRVYLTLVVPAVIAVAIFSYVIYIGWAPLPSLGPLQQVGSTTLSRLQEYELETGNATAVSAAIAASKPVSPLNFDYAVVGCMVLALMPYCVDVTYKDRQLRQHESDFTDFLFELSELVRGGIDPIKAVNTLAAGSLGSITKEVQTVAKQMLIGYSFETAMRNLAVSLKSPLIEKYVDLVVQASYSGGNVANLIQRASADMSTFLAIEREKRAGLAQYTLILYTAQVILIGLCAIIVVQFLPDLSAISTIGSTALAGSILGQADIGSVNLEGDLFYLLLINGFLGGLVIGKISETKIKHGIKHGLILMVIALLAWSIFVVPFASGSTTHYEYKIGPHSTTGYPTLPLAMPVTVQVNNTNGSPAVSVLVTFGVSGPSPGTATPATADTDSNGQVSTTAIMGSLPGNYFVTVSVAGNTTGFLVVVNATSGG